MYPIKLKQSTHRMHANMFSGCTEKISAYTLGPIFLAPDDDSFQKYLLELSLNGHQINHSVIYPNYIKGTPGTLGSYCNTINTV